MKLHVGCGKRYIPGWTHVDCAYYQHVDYCTDVSDLWMVEDETCDIVYACHVLEYFDWQEIENKVLPEWHRVLKPGGTLRVAVPDMKTIAKLYVNGITTTFLNKPPALRRTFNIECQLSDIIGPLYGRWETPNDFIYHKCVLDFETLGRIMSRAGFTEIHRYDWGKTEHAHIDDYSQAYLPYMDKENGTLISLNMEATK